MKYKQDEITAWAATEPRVLRLMRAGQHSEAVALIKAQMARAGSGCLSHVYHDMLAGCYGNMGQLELALAHALEAYVAVPKDSADSVCSLIFRIAPLQVRMNDLTGAKETLLIALRGGITNIPCAVHCVESMLGLPAAIVLPSDLELCRQVLRKSLLQHGATSSPDDSLCDLLMKCKDQKDEAHPES